MHTVYISIKFYQAVRSNQTLYYIGSPLARV